VESSAAAGDPPSESPAATAETPRAVVRVESAAPAGDPPRESPAPHVVARREPPADADDGGDTVVHVHIERLEVLGQPVERPAPPQPREPVLSLDEYLARGAERRR